MRILLTADLHYNHGKGPALAQEVIGQMNAAGGDVLVVIGDTAVADGEALEQCLSLFKFNGPKLLVAGNHELWTRSEDSYSIFTQDLPRRAEALGWHWLENKPFIADDMAIVGTIGWYDYSFARPQLGIPNRFYAAKVSPGAAKQLGGFDHLFENSDDIGLTDQIVARWNDGKFVKLGRSDEEFLQESLDRLDEQLKRLDQMRLVVACTHHVPFAQLLPPPHSAQWDFAKAYLGSGRMGEVLSAYPNVRNVFCGHSHMPITTSIGPIRAVNIGSGYRAKHFEILEI